MEDAVVHFKGRLKNVMSASTRAVSTPKKDDSLSVEILTCIKCWQKLKIYVPIQVRGCSQLFLSQWSCGLAMYRTGFTAGSVVGM